MSFSRFFSVLAAILISFTLLDMPNACFTPGHILTCERIQVASILEPGGVKWETVDILRSFD